jgi:hypothetical protein
MIISTPAKIELELKLRLHPNDIINLLELSATVSKTPNIPIDQVDLIARLAAAATSPVRELIDYNH